MGRSTPRITWRYLIVAVMFISPLVHMQDMQLDLDFDGEEYDIMPIVDELPDVTCEEDSIWVTFTFTRSFVGMLYPKGLSKNERCVTQGNGSTLLTVRVPYEDCDTLREDTDDGNRSFTSTVVVQSHPLLVTGDDTAYQIGCYLPLTAWKDVNTRFRVSTATEPPEPLWATPAMPACWLLISATLGGAAVRGAVGVGDPLFFSVEMDKSATYGFTVHNCSVRDDVMGMSQTLIDENGCAVDERLFGQFTYDQEAQRVYTEFQAFRFPNRAQVLFRCDVRLCLKPRCVIPKCSEVAGTPRLKREARTQNGDSEDGDDGDAPLMIDVTNVIYVSDEPRYHVEDIVAERRWRLVTARQTNFSVSTNRIPLTSSQPAIFSFCMNTTELIQASVVCVLLVLASVCVILLAWRCSNAAISAKSGDVANGGDVAISGYVASSGDTANSGDVANSGDIGNNGGDVTKGDLATNSCSAPIARFDMVSTAYDQT